MCDSTTEIPIPDDLFIRLIVAIPSKFPLGQVVITANAHQRLSILDVRKGLCRHASGDWGDLDQHDASENDRSLEDGNRLLSAYGQGEKRFWIITEADRSVTTVLLPQDY